MRTIHSYLLRCVFVLFSLTGMVHHSLAQEKESTLHHLNDLLIHTVMEDLYTPPVASRIYVYPNIAYYECIRHSDPGVPTLTGKLNGLKTLPSPKTNIDPFIAASVSFSYVAKNLIASEYRFDAWLKNFTDSMTVVSDSTTVAVSYHFGREVADSILSWMTNDNYMRSRGMMRYVASDMPGTWQPTPSDYAQGLEPHWTTIRPLTLTSPSQFSPKNKLKYDKSRNSLFFKNVMELYAMTKKLDSNQRKIALYWDDNPNVSVVEGHLTYFVHKISPGGHWMMIAKQACIKKQVPVVKASLAYTASSIAMFDGFIACWNEKYKTNLVRPITFINTHIDQEWQPMIQTPPFPEFTSGHAVVSNAAATVLTELLGDNFAFKDDTEIPFGQGSRSFPSFLAAASESSMSRVYAGIHYPETAKISMQQGKMIGSHVIKTLFGKISTK